MVALGPEETQKNLEKVKNGEFDIVAMTYASGGVGLNLQQYSVVVCVEPATIYDMYVQAYARAFRNGQKNMVKIYRLITPDSYDLDAHERHNKRQHFADCIFKTNYVGNTMIGIDEYEEILPCEKLCEKQVDLECLGDYEKILENSFEMRVLLKKTESLKEDTMEEAEDKPITFKKAAAPAVSEGVQEIKYVNPQLND